MGRSAAALVGVLVVVGVRALPQNANSKSLGGNSSGGSGQTSNNIDFTEERDAEDLRYKQVIQAGQHSRLGMLTVGINHFFWLLSLQTSFLVIFIANLLSCYFC